MGKYKLTYFNFRARAEVSRMLFTLAGVEFEDKRIERADWDEAKKSINIPFGQMPTLEVDGEILCQSRAIERFLARRFGLAGKTDIEQAKVDMIMECLEDTIIPMVAIFREPDESKKDELRKKYEEKLPQFLSDIEKILKANKGGDGFFVGDELTVADLSVIQILTMPAAVKVDMDKQFEKVPKLKAHKKRVESVPKIAQWIANRPQTAV